MPQKGILFFYSMRLGCFVQNQRLGEYASDRILLGLRLKELITLYLYKPSTAINFFVKFT